MTIVFYVTGHGYGHARRSAQIMATLRRRGVRVIVRSTAPSWIFHGAGVDPSDVDAIGIDPGVAEIDAMTIDPVGTANRLDAFMADAPRILERELEAVRSLKPAMIVTDIGWLAGDVAERLGVPCVASGNFTWDFMYEPMVGHFDLGRWHLAMIREGYGTMTAVLRHPFGHEMPQFKRVIDVPIVARKAAMDRAEAARRLGLDRHDRRPRVLIGMRGGLAGEAVVAAANGTRECVFTTMQDLPPNAPENLRRIGGDGMDFTDVLAAHDVIVTKLGYGIVADCIANQVRLLWPPRSGFSEDPLFEPLAPTLVPMRRIDQEDFVAGRWGDALRGLMAAPTPTLAAHTDGAELCADWLLGGKF